MEAVGAIARQAVKTGGSRVEKQAVAQANRAARAVSRSTIDPDALHLTTFGRTVHEWAEEFKASNALAQHAKSAGRLAKYTAAAASGGALIGTILAPGAGTVAGFTAGMSLGRAAGKVRNASESLTKPANWLSTGWSTFSLVTGLSILGGAASEYLAPGTGHAALSTGMHVASLAGVTAASAHGLWHEARSFLPKGVSWGSVMTATGLGATAAASVIGEQIAPGSGAMIHHIGTEVSLAAGPAIVGIKAGWDWLSRRYH